MYDGIIDVLEKYSDRLRAAAIQHRREVHTIFVVVVVAMFSLILILLIGLWQNTPSNLINIIVSFYALMVIMVAAIYAFLWMRRRAFAAENLSIQITLERLIRRASKLHDFGQLDEQSSLRFEMVLADAEAALELSKSVGKIFPRSVESRTAQDYGYRKNSVVEAMFGSALPSEVFSEVASTVLDAQLIRRDVDVLLDLREVEQGRGGRSLGKLIIAMSVTSSFHNITRERVVLPLRWSFGHNNNSDDRRYASFEIMVNGKIIQPDVTLVSSKHTPRESYEVVLNAEPHEALQVRTRLRWLVDRSDHYLLVSNHPTMGMRLACHIGVEGLKWDVTTATPSFHVLKKDDQTYVAESERPLLPYQSVLIWWKPAGVDAVAVASAP